LQLVACAVMVATDGYTGPGATALLFVCMGAYGNN
jgi:hypothetical protein